MSQRCYQMKRKSTSKEVVESISAENIELNLLRQELERLTQENTTLKNDIQLLKKPKADKVIVSDETVIAEIQLAMIKQKAFAGELTLEEIKKYDLLVKNKKLAEGSPTVIADYKRLPDNIEEEDLILIASKPINE